MASLLGTTSLNETIEQALEKTAALLCVLSPRYLKSDSCGKEIEHFFKVAGQQRGLQIGDRHRVFKVVKTKIPRAAHPRELQGLLGYEFYEDGTGREFDHIIT